MNTLHQCALVMLTAFGLTLTAYAAQGQQGRSGQWASFQKVDADGNGMISKEEAGSVQGLDFTKADRNNDGQISRSEYEAVKGGGQKGRQGTQQRQQKGYGTR